MVTVGMYYDVIPGKAGLFTAKFRDVVAALEAVPGHKATHLYQRVVWNNFRARTCLTPDLKQRDCLCALRPRSIQYLVDSYQRVRLDGVQMVGVSVKRRQNVYYLPANDKLGELHQIL